MYLQCNIQMQRDTTQPVKHMQNADHVIES